MDLLNAEIPADAKLLMISAPSVDYTSAEIAKLDSFFANGGGAFIMFNTSNNTSMPNLESALSTWGIEVSQSVSVEEDMDHTLMISTTGNTLCVPEIAEHSITQPLIDNDRTVAYLPYARTLTQLFETNTSYKTSVLMSTTQSSHTAFDYNNLDAAADTAGSYPIMIASENSMNNSRIVVAGATMMYSVDEQTISTSFGLANYDLLGNIYSYLSGSDDFNITAKSLLSSRLSMTSTGVIVTGLILILIPIVLLVYGIVVVYKRKNL